MENVISEFRIVETDDGYRIEIKGDKEAIKSMMDIRSMMGGFPFGHRHRGPRHFFRGGPSFWGAPFFAKMMGDWCRSWMEEDEESEPAAESTAAA